MQYRGLLTLFACLLLLTSAARAADVYPPAAWDKTPAEWNNEALDYFEKGDLTHARQCLEKIFEMSEDYYGSPYATLHANYKKVLDKLGDKAAIQEFDKRQAAYRKHHAPQAVPEDKKQSEDAGGGSGGGRTRAMIDSADPVEPNEPLMDLQQARLYLLSLINKDRVAAGLQPCILDEAATRAAQLHSDDTAKVGYNDHYDAEGRSPDWRYTLVGGTDMIMENQLGVAYAPELQYVLPPQQRFTANEIEHVHQVFFDEKPPQDGHRKNILNPRHNKVGLGLTLCWIRNGDYGMRDVTCCEEFSDAYGKFAPMPMAAEPGQTLTIMGQLPPPFQLYNVDVLRDDLPKPKPLEELRKNYYHGYQIPDKRVTTFWPRDVQFLPNGYFRVVIPVDKGWKKGLYYFNIWASRNGSQDDVFVTSRRIVAIGSTDKK